MLNPKVQMVARILLGLILVIFGLNKFLQFMPAPTDMPAAAGAFMGALAATGYMFPVIAVVEVLSGAALLANKYIKVALLLFAPISVNILLYHIFLDPGTIVPGLLVFLLTLYLLLANKDSFHNVLRA